MTEVIPVICVVGPTASGKSELAQRIAEDLHGSIISVDSMQVYRGMDIGTAKVPAPARSVPYHGIDLVNPGDPFSAALFQGYARDVIGDLSACSVPAILVGGTGFYLKAVIDDMDFAEGKQIGNAVRERYQRYYEEHGAHELWELLSRTDTLSASVIHENDVKRVIRAFELLESGDNYHRRLKSLSSVRPWITAVQIGIDVDPEVLGDAIDARVARMREEGLVDEVRGLLESGFREGITAPQAIGYKEIVEALDGRCTLDEAFERIRVATRRYAKRQRTWFRKDKRIHWIASDGRGANALFEEAMGIIAETVGSGDGHDGI